jgi:hypothetical protein
VPAGATNALAPATVNLAHLAPRQVRSRVPRPGPMRQTAHICRLETNTVLNVPKVARPACSRRAGEH